MSETTLSKRARKKQAREAQAQGGTRSESVASEPKKDELSFSATATPTELDPEFKLREGGSPFIEVVQKKIRNLTKRRVIYPQLVRRGLSANIPNL
jgi:hypothetical protein